MGTLASYDLQSLLTKYNTPVFFETGTAEGEGIKYASLFKFKNIYSVEIIAEQVQKMRNKFFALLYDFDHLHIIHGDSYSIMKYYLPTIKENIIFWLDAHYPGADLIYDNIPKKIETYLGNNLDDFKIRLPLEAELNLIKDLRKNNKDVILLDDLNIYSNNISPEAVWLMPKQRFNENFYKEVLKETHHFEQVNETQGMLLPND